MQNTNLLSEYHSDQFQQGSEHALSYFFNTYYPALCLYAQRLCGEDGFAEEMATEAFYQTWLQREQFQSGSSIPAYLYTVVKHGCYRHSRLKQKMAGINSMPSPEPDKTVDETIVLAETIRQLHECINDLPPQCKAVMRAVYIEGKTVNEIAKEMHLSISTVKTHKRNGIDMLRRRFNPCVLLVLLQLFS